MNDMRRTILWVVFSVSLVLLWDAWQRHNGHASLFSPAPARPAAVAGPAPASGAAQGSLPTPAAVPGATAVAAAPAVPAASAPPSETLTITTDLFKATLDSRGGALVRLELLKHTDEHDAKQHLLLFDQSAQRAYSAQTGLITSVPGVVLPNHLTAMTAQPGERALKDGANELSVTFDAAEQGGVKLSKTYTFHRGSYAIGVKHTLTNTSAAPVTPQLYLQLVRDGNVESASAFMGPTSYTGPAIYTDVGKFQKVEFGDIAKKKAEHVNKADDGYIAMVQHYFATAWLVNAQAAREFRTEEAGPNLYRVAMVLPLGELAPGASKTQDAVLFAGPQAESTIEKLAPGLELVKDYGWLKVIAKPLFWLLEQLHAVLGNWGWAIVALVVLLKIAFYWLNASAYRSMAKMKAINPRVMDLRERYKEKPQQMQQEMMRIYKEEKVNPLGGCLPIVVQMPFFFALYWVLLSSVEMRGAPWLGWITDLSVKDPLYILPVLMTGSTMFQTWLNPTPPDPVQAKMMWIMPLMFSVMFFVFPAGLVLYWLTNNVLGIAQQWFINKRMGVNP
ncbi:MAG: membrane protein insertase YidC [Burkholderiales bacterium]|nr:membrane protein insertase YidC [Burkholderiales bacterium]